MARRTHGDSALQRREALLRAAVDIVAEAGPGAATHRAIAARAGLPPATTSYFFASIDELLAEATRHFAAEQAAAYDELAKQLDQVPPGEFVARFAAALVGSDRTIELAQVEAYLHAARDPALRPAATAVREAFVRTATHALVVAGVPDAERHADFLVSYVDGFLLHHLADPRPDDEVRLQAGLTFLLQHLTGSRTVSEAGVMPSR